MKLIVAGNHLGDSTLVAGRIEVVKFFLSKPWIHCTNCSNCTNSNEMFSVPCVFDLIRQIRRLADALALTVWTPLLS